MENTLLTIIMPSFNKGKYISEAINSVINQKTDISYKLIVADDCSNDNTISIVETLQKKHPDKLMLFKSSANQMLFRNVFRVYEKLNSKYFCVLDADDFWTDDLFIQKATDFLESHSDYTIYSANFDKLLPTGEKNLFVQYAPLEYTSTFDELLEHGKFILGTTGMCFFRNIAFTSANLEKMRKKQGTISESSFRGDSFRTFSHLHYGKGYFINEVCGIYRITTEGLWQGTSDFSHSVIHAQFYLDMFEYFDEQYSRFLDIAYKHFKHALVPLSNISKEECSEKELLQLYNIRKRIYLRREILNNISADKSEQKTKHDPKLGWKMQLYISVYNRIRRKLEKKGLLHNYLF